MFARRATHFTRTLVGVSHRNFRRRIATQQLSLRPVTTDGGSSFGARAALGMLVVFGTGAGAAVGFGQLNAEQLLLAERPRATHSSKQGPWHGDFTVDYPAAYKSLKEKLGEDLISTDEDELEGHGKEMSGYATPSNPQIVVWPETTEHVSEIMKISNKYNIPVVPYAAGTSLEGHTVASKGGICLDVKNMNQILKVNVDDMDCVVQPGVGWVELNDHCKEYNMFLGVDPAPGACIGGMCGTCCSGTNAVRYGTMKNQVLNLTVVLADGTVIKTGQRARKSSAGYDLAGLFVGSEGTLGVVTEATLRLRNIPEHICVARVNFPSVHAACSAVIKILQKGTQLGAIELLDENMVDAVNKYSGLQLPRTPCILFKFTGPEPHVRHDIKVVEGITSEFTKDGFHFSKNKEECAELWEARKHAFWAAQTFEENKEIMATDVAVPISQLADCIMETKKDLDKSFLFAPIVGHVGDGNFHTVIAFDPNNPDESEEAHRLNRKMVYRAIDMEGTCTGEHGIGGGNGIYSGKKEYLVPEKGKNAVELMKTVKRALDPKARLNPGKIVDLD